MLKTLLLLGGLMACSLPASADTDIRAESEAVRADYGDVAPTADIVIMGPCHQANAEYVPLLDMVFMCPEWAQLPPAQVRFIAAHEFAHAVMFEHGVADVDDEAGADELATLVLEEADDRAAVMGGAEFFMALLKNPPKGDEHPANMVRARDLLCLDDGADGDDAADANCALYYKRATASWIRLLVTVLSAEHARG